MDVNSLEQLRLLSDKIQEEEMSILFERMADLLLNEDTEKKESEDPRKQTEREKTVSLLLRSMRIHLCLDLIKQGHSSCIEEVKKDWNEIIDCLKFLECVWKIPNELLSDAVDIILLLDPSKRNDLLKLLDFPTRLKIKKQKPLRYHVVNCAFNMAGYCLETSRAEELFRIIENLVALSEERNPGDPNKHRVVIANALRYIVDNDRELTCRICDSSSQFFEGVTDANACNFYWFYAFALMNTGRSEEAVPLFKKCHDLCMDVEGERSWIGARAGSFYYYHQIFAGNSHAGEHYLWDSLKKIDNKFYSGMDETADFVAASTRAILLRFRMDKQNLRGLLPELQRFRDYCVTVEDSNINPNLTVRHAENMLSGYYLEVGDYLQAADHARKALNSIPANDVPAEPSDILIYTNLLLIYTALNDVDQMAYYVQKLVELSDEFEDDDYVMSRVSLIVNTASKKLQIDPEGMEDDRQYLEDIYQSISNYELEHADSVTENVTFAQWILDLCSGILDSGSASPEELVHFREIVDFFRNHPTTYPFNNTQKATCYTLLTQIEWQLASPKALDHLAQCLHYLNSISESREVRIAILRFAAVAYYNYHRMDLALSVVDEVLTGIASAWHKATAYLNDHRVCELLSFIQFHFNVCYAIMRTVVEPEELYERVLQFKDLPALVGRERNKILRLAPVDEKLKKQIFTLQDQLAAAELNDSLQGTNTAQDVAVQLERKEAEFAAQFPQNLYFTDINFERVCDKLPDNSAIIEYYFVLGESALTNKPYDADAWDLDIFITAKRNKIAQLNHLRVHRGDIIVNQAAEFIDILQNPDDISTFGKKATLRADLYRSLIAPALPFLEGITNLFIAPDDNLCNLPFEILYADGSGLLQDKFKVCRLVCGRDILFHDDHTSTDGSSFILGDPNYDSERGEQTNSLIRGGQMSLEPVSSLPFSGIEAVRIARRCRSNVYSGDAATKYALQNALPCSIIHLATHGVFDDQLETDSLYASHLVFAGYNKWVSRKTESSYCGNGVLTADEISRMDLKKTELVVLSACQSGLGDTSYGSVRGLLSAFSAAGARWVISHMWEASDFSTPILMDAFYNAYLNKGMDVPDALQYAKNYLRTVTIGELRRKGWLDLPADSRFTEGIREAVAEMEEWDANETPFDDEFFWGGFTVHKSR